MDPEGTVHEENYTDERESSSFLSGFLSDKNLHVCDLSNNLEDFYDLVLQGYGETVSFMANHHISFDLWHKCILISVGHANLLDRCLIYCPHTQVEWSGTEAVSKIYLFDNLTEDSNKEKTVELLISHLIAKLIDIYGTNEIANKNHKIDLITNKNDYQHAINYWNNQLQSILNTNKVNYLVSATDNLKMYYIEKTIKDTIKNNDIIDNDINNDINNNINNNKYSFKKAEEEDIKNIIEEWNTNSMTLADEFKINIYDKLQNHVVYVIKQYKICKKEVEVEKEDTEVEVKVEEVDTQIEIQEVVGFACIKEVILKETTIAEIVITYTYSSLNSIIADHVIGLLLKYIVNVYIDNNNNNNTDNNNDNDTFNCVCTFPVSDVPIENYEPLIKIGFKSIDSLILCKLNIDFLLIATATTAPIPRLNSLNKSRPSNTNKRLPKNTKQLLQSNKLKSTTPTIVDTPDDNNNNNNNNDNITENDTTTDNADKVDNAYNNNNNNNNVAKKVIRPPGMGGMGKIDLTEVKLKKTGINLKSNDDKRKSSNNNNNNIDNRRSTTNQMAKRSSFIVADDQPMKPLNNNNNNNNNKKGISINLTPVPLPGISTKNNNNKEINIKEVDKEADNDKNNNDNDDRNNKDNEIIELNDDNVNNNNNNNKEKSTKEINNDVNREITNKIKEVTIAMTVPVTNSKKEKFTAYVILLKFEDKTERTVLRRYSECLSFHHQLSKLFKKLPPFPSKKLIGNLKEGFVEKRKEKIEFYFQQIIQRDDVMNNKVMQDFINEEVKSKKK